MPETAINQASWRREKTADRISAFVKDFEAVLKSCAQCEGIKPRKDRSGMKSATLRAGKGLFLTRGEGGGCESFLIFDHGKISHFLHLEADDSFMCSEGRRQFLLPGFGRGMCRTAFSKMRRLWDAQCKIKKA